MSYALTTQDLLAYSAATYNDASAYDYSQTHPLIELVFTQGSALFVEGAYYESQAQQLRAYARALIQAARVEPRFPWQFAAWMRDPRQGKGNRIQGSLAPALLDATFGPLEHTARYVALCLRHRPDDVIAFVLHYKKLGLGTPSQAARQGMALALAAFDEYQLMKYARAKSELRLCDVIMMARQELEALGPEGQLALAVGRYLHAPSRAKAALLEQLPLPLTRARRALWARSKDAARSPQFAQLVHPARVTWEQLMSHFGASAQACQGQGSLAREARQRNLGVWRAMLDQPSLLPDVAFMRNLKNMIDAGVSMPQLVAAASKRRFQGVWPHQIYAAYKAHEDLLPVCDAMLARTIEQLPAGRHLGLGDASGSMNVAVGGPHSSVTARDVAFCLVGLMSQTSGLGGSFADASWFGSRSGASYLALKQREPHEGPLTFCRRRGLRSGMGGTQVFGAVLELIAWLKAHPEVQPPDCLWFFSDMQFDPAAQATGSDRLPEAMLERAQALGMGLGRPPLELALELYRQELGPVDVVLWNLAAYRATPVPSDMKGVLLVSGFDANTFKHVAAWRRGDAQDLVEVNQEVILDAIRAY